ncbi:MAG: hypothetical protein AAF547_16050 [Actinomycetota bacterium]
MADHSTGPGSGVEPVAAPPPPSIDEAMADALRWSKADLVAAGGDALPQLGARDLGSFAGIDILADADDGLVTLAADATAEGAVIETFVATDGSCTPMGAPTALVEAWRPLAAALAERVRAAAEAAGIRIADTGYVTASLTPSDQILGDPHLDDDQFQPSAGLGLVALTSTSGGTRVAAEPIDCPTPRPGLPLTVPDRVIADFAAGSIACHQAEAGRIVLFPQFGQLHAGPRLVDGPPGLRSLLVYRVETIATAPDRRSGPSAA